jgi:hypothetical protein
MVFETLVFSPLNHLTRLIVRENSVAGKATNVMTISFSRRILIHGVGTTACVIQWRMINGKLILHRKLLRIWKEAVAVRFSWLANVSRHFGNMW